MRDGEWSFQALVMSYLIWLLVTGMWTLWKFIRLYTMIFAYIYANIYIFLYIHYTSIEVTKINTEQCLSFFIWGLILFPVLFFFVCLIKDGCMGLYFAVLGRTWGGVWCKRDKLDTFPTPYLVGPDGVNQLIIRLRCLEMAVVLEIISHGSGEETEV